MDNHQEEFYSHVSAEHEEFFLIGFRLSTVSKPALCCRSRVSSIIHILLDCCKLFDMSWKNRGTTVRRMNNTATALMGKRHCLLFFPKEDTHGIWPDHLIRSRGRFGFEAKHGKEWFECRIEKEGEMPVYYSPGSH